MSDGLCGCTPNSSDDCEFGQLQEQLADLQRQLAAAREAIQYAVEQLRIIVTDDKHITKNVFGHLETALAQIDCNVKVRFGLRAQGHIPTIERMLADGSDWEEIGVAIGWHGQTARKHYERLGAPSVGSAETRDGEEKR